MKSITKVILSVMFAMIFAQGSQASAGTVCYVYLTAPCLAAGSPISFRWFADGDGLANMNAARCLERAQEYKSWCTTPGLEAYTIFQVDGSNRIGALTSSDGHVYISDGVARSTAFHN